MAIDTVRFQFHHESCLPHHIKRFLEIQEHAKSMAAISEVSIYLILQPYDLSIVLRLFRKPVCILVKTEFFSRYHTSLLATKRSITSQSVEVSAMGLYTSLSRADLYHL